MKKKIFMACLLLACTLCAKAQVYLGGTLSVNTQSFRTSDNTETVNTFTFEPEVGYNISKAWAVGMSLGVGTTTGSSNTDATIWGITPYVRWTFARVKIVDFFATAAYSYLNTHYEQGTGTMHTHSGILSPGLLVNLSDHWQLAGMMHLFRYSSYTIRGENLYDELDFSINNGVSLGVYYKF